MWSVCEKLGLSWHTYEFISRLLIFKFKVIRYRHFPWAIPWPWLFFAFWPLSKIPVPMWVGHLYYQVSYILWRHPSCYHWKRSNLMGGCSCKRHWDRGTELAKDVLINGYMGKDWRDANGYMSGHRCIWCGCYSDFCRDSRGRLRK